MAETLLYVGVASGIVSTRLTQHRRLKPWWPKVARKTAVWYRTRIEALSAETLAIHDENPVHNLRKDHPLPIRADGMPGGWIHMIPESTVRFTLDSILTAVNQHNLTVGVTAQGSQECRAVLVPADWFHKTEASINGGSGAMNQYDEEDARRRFRDLLDDAQAGEPAEITRNGKIVALLVPVAWEQGARLLGEVITAQARAMEAARIEMLQNGPAEAMEWILNAIPDVSGEDPEDEWDGKESAREWFERTKETR